MSDIQDLGQRYTAALWEAARSLTLGSDTGGHQLAGLVEDITQVEAQLAGLRLHLLHEARLTAADAVLDQTRHSVRTSAAEASAALRLSQELGDRFALIAAALNDGTISLPQADAIVAGLRKLPARLSKTDLIRCQESILAHTDTLGPSELRVLAARLWEVIDPDTAEAEQAQRLAAEERAAHRNRYLRLAPDHHGSMRLTGLLPVADGALLAAQLEALMPPRSSYPEESPAPEMRRADALMHLAAIAAGTGQLPAHGGDRPHVHVTVDYETLVTGLGRSEILGGNGLESISAAQARRLACDAGIIPITLGGASQPLDVGRAHRLFTPAIRDALTQRDKGCVFPGCTTGPAACHGHHITPWWNQGESSLSNAVLVCAYHHCIVEPDPQLSTDAQWQIHLDEITGLPWFTPPRHIDPRQRPRQHHRHRLQQIQLHPQVLPATAEPPDYEDLGPPLSGYESDRARLLEELLQHASPVWQSADA